MTDLRARMIAEARARWGEILPCGPRETLDDSFTVEGDTVIFWFNLPNGETHNVIRRRR